MVSLSQVQKAIQVVEARPKPSKAKAKSTTRIARQRGPGMDKLIEICENPYQDLSDETISSMVSLLTRAAYAKSKGKIEDNDLYHIVLRDTEYLISEDLWVLRHQVDTAYAKAKVQLRAQALGMRLESGTDLAEIYNQLQSKLEERVRNWTAFFSESPFLYGDHFKNEEGRAGLSIDRLVSKREAKRMKL